MLYLMIIFPVCVLYDLEIDSTFGIYSIKLHSINFYVISL